MKKQNFLSKLIIFIAVLLLLPLNSFPKPVSGEYERGVLQNTVIFLSFEQSGSNFEENFNEAVYEMYQTTTHSVKNYLLEQSGGLLDMQTKILTFNGDWFARAQNGVDYYKPRYKWVNNSYVEINPVGYDNRYFNKNGVAVAPEKANSLQSIEGAYREQTLIKEIISGVNANGYNPDSDGDGLVDSLVIITDQDSNSEWGEILWPHKGVWHGFNGGMINYYYAGENPDSYRLNGQPLINDANVYSYNIISSSQIVEKRVGEDNQAVSEQEQNLYNVGVLAHEILHTVGLSDYYSYEDSAYESVGELDVMGTTYALPQNMLAYLKLKLGWLNYDDILYINDSGEYSLPLANSKNGKVVAKIVLSDFLETGEYFMAEFRSSDFVLQNSAYDGSLSGTGVVIYRVNPAYAYINSLHEKGNVDYGNMYGDDEVYVYRLGGYAETKKVVSPLGISYSLLGSGQPVITWDGGYYDNCSYGNADKTKTVDNLVTSLVSPSESIICYSNGTNSGIVFSDISIDEQKQCVNFKVELPEKQGTIPILSADSVGLLESNGKNYLTWTNAVKSGNAHVLVVRSTNRLKQLAEKGSSGITIQDFKKQKLSLYNTLYYTTVPVAEKYFKLPNFEEDALVFIAIESQNGNSAVRYVGSIEIENPTFWQYYNTLVDPIYYIIATIALVVIILGAIGIFSLKKSSEKKRTYK